MTEDVAGALIVCQDNRLQATGDLQECLKRRAKPGSNIAVKLVKRVGFLGYWGEVATGYWAEIVISPPIAPYQGPPSTCRLPEQFDRFLRQ